MCVPIIDLARGLGGVHLGHNAGQNGPRYAKAANYKPNTASDRALQALILSTSTATIVDLQSCRLPRLRST